MADIRQLAEDLVATTVTSPADLVLEELPDIRMPGTNQPFVELLQDYATADGSVRIPKFAFGRYLLPRELRRLLADGVVGPLEGFYSQRTRKHYDASLRWNAASNRYELFFDRLQEPSTEDHPQVGVCRHCGGAVRERQSRYVCVNATGESPTCGFALKRLWCGREITCDEAVQLLADGRTDVLEGFRGKNGRPFKATITVGPDGKVAFEFPAPRRKPG
jgi:DNA topoisomerase-3